MKAEVPAADRVILSVDTSLPILSVALTRSDHLLGGVTLLGAESRNEKVLPAIEWLISEAGLARQDLDLLTVTRGPGSFTGVRVGLATIQGLSFALGIPICAMSTHEAFAEDMRAGASSALIYGDAGRGEFYVSAFVDDLEVIGPVLMKKEEVDALREQYARSLDIGERLDSVNVALLAARRASRLWSSGVSGRYDAATPIYVRLAEAEVRLLKKADEPTGARN